MLFIHMNTSVLVVYTANGPYFVAYIPAQYNVTFGSGINLSVLLTEKTFIMVYTGSVN